VDSSSGGGDDPEAVPEVDRGAGDLDQTGSGDGPREPIGGLPVRRQGRFEAPLYPYQPQHAWLQGSALIVEFDGESAMCNLVTAARIAIRRRPVPVFNGGWVFSVLFACQEVGSTPARLVLTGPGWCLLTGAQLRRLAELIGARPDSGDRAMRRIIRRLNNIADDQDARSQTLDWSFRTDPAGLRRNEKSK
jgi:hypothetical protein